MRENTMNETGNEGGSVTVGLPEPREDLLSCPFCGEKRIFLNKPGFNYKYGSINCPACLIVMPGEVNEAELIKCWNTRAAPSTEIETLLFEAYQVIGTLLSDTRQFGTEHGNKILDNLSAHFYSNVVNHIGGRVARV